MASNALYQSLKNKAQLMSSEDEFRVRCREAYETGGITAAEYKELLTYRRGLHRNQDGHPNTADVEV